MSAVAASRSAGVRLQTRPPRLVPVWPPRSRSAATDAAKEKAEQAKEGASKAADRAKSLASDGTEKAKAVASAAGARLSSVSSSLGQYYLALQGPTLHGLAVTREVAKQVYVGEKLSPPAPSEFSPVWQEIWDKAKSHDWWERTLTDGSWRLVALVALEAYLLFKLGEMVGRRSLQGYHIKARGFETHAQ